MVRNIEIDKWSRFRRDEGKRLKRIYLLGLEQDLRVTRYFFVAAIWILIQVLALLH